MFYHTGDLDDQHIDFHVSLDVVIKIQFVGIAPVILEFNVIVAVLEEFTMGKGGPESLPWSVNNRLQYKGLKASTSKLQWSLLAFVTHSEGKMSSTK